MSISLAFLSLEIELKQCVRLALNCSDKLRFTFVFGISAALRTSCRHLRFYSNRCFLNHLSLRISRGHWTSRNLSALSVFISTMTGLDWGIHLEVHPALKAGPPCRKADCFVEPCLLPSLKPPDVLPDPQELFVLALHSISKQEERKGLKGEIYASKK